MTNRVFPYRSPTTRLLAKEIAEYKAEVRKQLKELPRTGQYIVHIEDKTPGFMGTVGHYGPCSLEEAKAWRASLELPNTFDSFIIELRNHGTLGNHPNGDS